jgi:hypothetical protein
MRKIVKPTPTNTNLLPEESDKQFWDGLQAKASELSAARKAKIIPFAVQDRDTQERLPGYMYELDPITDAKLYAAQIAGPEVSISKALQAADSMVLWGDSDPRLAEKKYKKAVALCVLGQVESAVPLLKKK